MARMEIQTPRFLLRDFVPADEPVYVRQHTDPRGAPWRAPEELTEAHARRIFGLFLAWAAERPRRNHQLAVCRRDAPETPIGTAGIRRHGCAPGVAEMGIALAREWRGRYRYANEVIEAMLDFGFGTLGLEEVRGVTAAANAAVNRLARQYGFEEAAGRGAEDGVTWRLSRARWDVWRADHFRG